MKNAPSDERAKKEITVLLVEKDPAFRAKLTAELVESGCIVLECETIEQAEMIVSIHGSVIDRVVFDAAHLGFI